MQILDGKKIAADIRLGLKVQVIKMEPKPGLAAILVGDDPASKTYIAIKEKACKEAGIIFFKHVYPENVPQEEIIELIEFLNKDKATHAILVQLPLPVSLDKDQIMSAVNPDKDADGFHLKNLRLLASGKSKIVPPTLAGIIKLLEETNQSLDDKTAVILANSQEFTEPLQHLLNQKGIKSASLIKTPEFSLLSQKADILIVALGQPEIVGADDIKKDAILIDVGFNYVGEKPVGDINAESVKGKAAFLSPVPGGTGPLTVAYLLANVIKLAKD